MAYGETEESRRLKRVEETLSRALAELAKVQAELERLKESVRAGAAR